MHCSAEAAAVLECFIVATYEVNLRVLVSAVASSTTASRRYARGARCAQLPPPRSCCQRTPPVAAAYVFSWDPLRLTGLTAEAAEAVALSGTTVAWLRLRDLAQPNIHTVVHTKVKNNGMYLTKLSWLFAYQQKKDSIRYVLRICRKIFNLGPPNEMYVFKGLALLTKCKYVSVFKQGTKQS